MQGSSPPSGLCSTIKILAGFVFLAQFFALLFTSIVLLAGTVIIVCIFVLLFVYVGVKHHRSGFILTYLTLLGVYCAWMGLQLGILCYYASFSYNYMYGYCYGTFLYCYLGGISGGAMIAISSILTVISWALCIAQIIYCTKLYLILKKLPQAAQQTVTYQTPQPVSYMPTAPMQVYQPQPVVMAPQPQPVTTATTTQQSF